MTDLFGNEVEVIRTLGFYQPFGSLMLHGKIETRWVKKGKKPPFPLGKYVFYTTQKQCSQTDLFNWCGTEVTYHIYKVLSNDDTRILNGFILSIGELVQVRPFEKEDEPMAFVNFVGERTIIDKNHNQTTQVQWALIFKDVTPVTPIPYHHGKQGVGFLDKQYLPFIK